jgi:DNA-binding CsgD family transcriptional regulator
VKPLVWGAGIPPEIREAIENTCTPDQVQAFKLKSQGYSLRRMGVLLGIDESSVRGLLRRGAQNVQREYAALWGIVGK